MKETIQIVAAATQQTIQNTLENNLPNTDGSFGKDFIQNIFNWSYAGAGLVAVVFIVYAAYRYASANGEPEKIKSATSMIIYSIIGLVIVLIAAAVTNFVISSVGDNIQ